MKKLDPLKINWIIDWTLHKASDMEIYRVQRKNDEYYYNKKVLNNFENTQHPLNDL